MIKQDGFNVYILLKSHSNVIGRELFLFLWERNQYKHIN